MTLAEWLKEHPNAYYPRTSPWWAIYPNDEPTEGLYHLSDFRVSSVSGTIIWLVPIKEKETQS